MLAMTVVRCFSLAIFASLAVHFNQWWIILFAVFFMVEYKRSDKTDDTAK